MDAICVLMDDHVFVESLFLRYQSALGFRHKHRLADELMTALTVHTWVEERLVYCPAAERSPLLMRQVLDQVAEHEQLRLRVDDVGWALVSSAPIGLREAHLDLAVEALRQAVQRHVDDEEGALFPQLSQVFGPDELEAMGQQLLLERERAPTRPGGPLSRGLGRAREIARGMLAAAWSLTHAYP